MAKNIGEKKLKSFFVGFIVLLEEKDDCCIISMRFDIF